ncbi:hypothetical protein [Streptomyces sp. NPDC089795]|uniref:hypothetical protein n=1 Tax=Streptomyces sp. NPDC089795 TaxID=3155297 RepID=UPI00342419CB
MLDKPDVAEQGPARLHMPHQHPPIDRTSVPTAHLSDAVGVEANGKVGEALSAVGNAVSKIGKAIPF